MPPVLVFFALATTAAVGLTLWRGTYERKEKQAGRPKAEEGEIVDADWPGDSVVVKIYAVHGAYEAHVYWHGAYLGKAGGFGDVEMAKGWGRAFARRKGADV